MFMWEQSESRFDPSLAMVDLWNGDDDPLDDSSPPFIDSAPLSGFVVGGGLILIGAEGRSALTIRLRSVQDGRVGAPTTSAE